MGDIVARTIKDDVGDLKAEMHELRGDIGDLKALIASAETRIIKCVVGTGIASAALAFTAGRLVH